MDREELVRKCQAIVLKEEEEDTITVMGKMREAGEEIAANCLVGKILLTRGVNREGLRAAMQQAWRTVKEVKIESMGENTFLFKFASEGEKKRVLMGGPWHFDRALLVLSELTGIGDIKEQSFTHTSFWVQIHNIPIMCMVREIIQKLGEKIGEVEEIKTDATGECIGQFARIRISINITHPLKKVVFLQEAGAKIPMPVLYEKLPEFCFCCAKIGHQFRECLKYKGQTKENLPYGGWMRAITPIERMKLARTRGRGNIEHPQSKTSEAAATRNQTQHNPTDLNGPNQSNTGKEMGDGTQPMVTNQETQDGNAVLILSAAEPDNQQSENENTSRETKKQHAKVADNDSQSKNKIIGAGKKNWREREVRGTDTKKGNDEEEVDNGLSSAKEKPKIRKWKLQARSSRIERGKDNGPINSKRPSSELAWPSPENKKKRILSSPKAPLNLQQLNFSQAKLQLEFIDTEQDETVDATTMVEDVLAGASSQPRQQQ
ncbi:hypothetical protein AB3S75_017241 [Citrus x aurantiifolia]